MQLKWTKNSAPKKIFYTMHNFPVYYVCNHFLHKFFFFHFPKKNNLMKGMRGCYISRKEKKIMVVFPTAYYVNMSL